MNRRSIITFFSFAVILFAILAVIVRFGNHRTPQPDEKKRPGGGSAVYSGDRSEAHRDRQTVPANSGENTAPTGVVANGREMVADMRLGLASGQTNEVCERALQLRQSPDAGVRLEVIRILGGIGWRALPELSDYLYDGDAAVSREAFRLWKGIVAGLPNENKKIQILLANLSVMTDQERIDELVAVLAALPKASAASTLLSVAQSSNPRAAEAARTAYQSLAGVADVSPSAVQESPQQDMRITN